jgi:hypothetical protein
VQKEFGPRDGDLNGGHGIQPGSPALLDSSGLIQWSGLRQDSTGVDWIRPSIHSNPSTVKSGLDSTTRRICDTTSMSNNDFVTSSEPTIKLRVTCDNADDQLQYETRYKVLVCRHHCYAVSNLSNHLRTEHSGTTKEKAAVARKYSYLDILRVTQVQLPPPLEPPIQSLGRPRDAFICDNEECGFITVGRDEIRKHCNNKHEWRSLKEDREHWHHIFVQSFFLSSSRQRYFSMNYKGDDFTEGAYVLGNYVGDTLRTG